MSWKKYIFKETTEFVTLKPSFNWTKDNEIKEAGFDPETPDLIVCELVGDWNGHLRGSRIILTQIIAGCPFAIEFRN